MTLQLIDWIIVIVSLLISLAVPMYLLYDLSILSVRWVERSRAKTQATETDADTGAGVTTTVDEPAEKTGA